jgi:tetratricopeptide (TPR) repeat protein
VRARRLSAVVLAFALAVAVFSATRGDERAAAGPGGGAGRGTTALALRPQADTDARIARLQADVRGGRTDRAAALAAAYLQKVRETGDASFYTRADALLNTALVRDPRDQGTLVQAATLAAARHDFRGALRLARRAQEVLPGTVAPLPILVDALVELGRYDEAERTLQRLVDLKPNLAAYARVSYFRELTGDLPGAIDAMRRAIAAGGPAPENVAYVQSLLGGLELARGRLGAARHAYDAALAAMPAYAPAAAGRARLAAAAGDLPEAIARWRRVVARLPLPEYVIALGEAELAAGRTAAGRRDLELVRGEQRLLAGAGVNTDVELAIFEADHGSPARGVALARAAWASAPSVRSADALGWALTRSGRPEAGLHWARRALRLGSLDPSLRYHAGMTALAAGRREAARDERPATPRARAAGRREAGRRDLRLAIAHGLAAQPLHLRRAREALR